MPSHAFFARREVTERTAVLVKITRRVRKDTGEEISAVASAVGLVDRLFAFDSPADCQMRDERAPDKKPRLGPTEKVEDFYDRTAASEPNLAFPPKWLPADDGD